MAGWVGGGRGVPRGALGKQYLYRRALASNRRMCLKRNKCSYLNRLFKRRVIKGPDSKNLRSFELQCPHTFVIKVNKEFYFKLNWVVSCWRYYTKTQGYTKHTWDCMSEQYGEYVINKDTFAYYNFYIYFGGDAKVQGRLN